MDINECAAAQILCGPGLVCTNTVGSFQCSSKRINGTPPICSAVYPNSCQLAGGIPLWILIGTISEATLAATVQIAGKNVSTITLAGQWIRILCPTASRPGAVAGRVIGSDGAPLCVFAFAYKAGPAAVMPLSVPLAGGKILLNMQGFAAVTAEGDCTVLYGSISGGKVNFAGGAEHFNTTAPPQDGYGEVPLLLDCGSPSLLVDLGVALEYRRTATLDLADGTAAMCRRLIPCVLPVVVHNPPGPASGGLRAQVYQAEWDLTAAANEQLLPILTVQVCAITVLFRPFRAVP